MNDIDLFRALKVKNVTKRYSIKDADEHRVLAALSYFFPLWIFTVIMCRKSEFTMFHARQGAMLSLFQVLCAFLFYLIYALLLPVSSWFSILMIPILLAFIILFAAWVLCLYSALIGKAITLPFLDVLAEK